LLSSDTPEIQAIEKLNFVENNVINIWKYSQQVLKNVPLSYFNKLV
jgi:ribosomal protein S30